MLNYIWAGLIVFSLVFALVADVRDLIRDPYRNNRPLPVTLRFPDGYDSAARLQPVEVVIDSAAFAGFYETEQRPAAAYGGELVQTSAGRELRFAGEDELPEPLAAIRAFTAREGEALRGAIGAFAPAPGAGLAAGTVRFAPVRFVKLNAIAEAAFDFAETAVSIAIGLIGVLALWLGLMQIAERSGLIQVLVRFIQPVFRPLFPEIPAGHPAMGMIILNMAANMLGLGNAATPMGIKAMEEMQKLNPSDDTATNPMVTFLAINTASVQLVPPATLVALMGLQVNQLFFSIILATAISTTIGILAARLLQRTPRNRASDPGNLTEDRPA